MLALIEKGTVGELAFALSLLVALLFALRHVLNVILKAPELPVDGFPLLDQVEVVDLSIIESWLCYLPEPKTISEHIVKNEIAHRYLCFNGLANVNDKRPTAKSMTCVCGHKHPFIHVFGKCGACMKDKAKSVNVCLLK